MPRQKSTDISIVAMNAATAKTGIFMKLATGLKRQLQWCVKMIPDFANSLLGRMYFLKASGISKGKYFDCISKCFCCLCS